MLNYTKLWLLLESRGMKRTDLKQIMSANTLAKLGKNEIVSSAVIEKICGFLNCQPGDIMEYISEEQMRTTAEQLDNLNKVLMQQLQAQGITEEQFATMMSQLMPEMVKNIYHGEKTMAEIYDKVIEDNLPKSE
ncbi:MAG: helix-turn-helix domain-containing protein [Tyzzerella sp.]|nr:helix-turn-helix domain-containing protein [Tyzzerella sp.]